MNATDRAALLGTEHGTQAAQEWCVTHQLDMPEMKRLVLNDDEEDRKRLWPKPSEFYNDMLAGISPFSEPMHAYEKAFTVAVESTIRQACQEVTE